MSFLYPPSNRVPEGGMASMRPWLMAFCVAASACGTAAGAGGDAPQGESRGEGEGRTRIVMLGTGTPAPNPERSGPAVAIVVDDRAYLVDCGPGVVRRMAAAGLRHQIAPLFPARPRHLFITHLHSDHTLGCPDLLLSGWTLGRDVPLEVWGPVGTGLLFRHIGEAYRADIDHRVGGIQPSNSSGFMASVTEISPGLVYEDELVRVTAVPVRHGEWEHAFGFRFDTPDRSIVISGDAAYSEALAEACNGCDVLIHEVMSPREVDGLAPEWRRYHRTYHTMTDELGRLATLARPSLLVLYHFGDRNVSAAELVDEVGATFRGRVVAANDLDVF
jgi:ribonuclease BN (tRNA processing enzyme)